MGARCGSQSMTAVFHSPRTQVNCCNLVLKQASAPYGQRVSDSRGGQAGGHACWCAGWVSRQADGQLIRTGACSKASSICTSRAGLLTRGLNMVCYVDSSAKWCALLCTKVCSVVHKSCAPSCTK
eukprot:37056-Chlamydomonas_euryale.AAC.1